MGRLTSVALIASALAVIYTVKKASDAAASVGQVITHDLNPASSTNVINRGLSAIVTDNSKQKNLGSWIYCKIHPNAIICQ